MKRNVKKEQERKKEELRKRHKIQPTNHKLLAIRKGNRRETQS